MQMIRVSGVPEHFNLPWHLGIEFGMFKSQGLEIEWQNQASGTGAMLEDLLLNRTDLAVVLTEGAIKALSEGLPFRLLKQYVSSPLIWGIHTGIQSNIEGPHDQASYAISRNGSGSQLMAVIDAHIRGFEIKKDKFRICGIIEPAIQELEQGLSDLFYWEKYMTQSYVDAGRVKRISEFLTPWPCFQILTREDFYKANKSALKALLDTLNFACKQFMFAENSIELVIERFELKPEDAQAWFYSTEWSTDFSISKKMLKNVVHTLKSTGTIEGEREIPLAEFVKLI